MGRMFERAEKYLDQLERGIWVEIGTSRGGDDGSTYTIAKWSIRFGVGSTLPIPFHTVDIDHEHCEKVRAWAALSDLSINVHNMPGEKYFDSRIVMPIVSFLYLDNFDWDWHPMQPEAFVIEQQARYKELGLDMNNVNSQRAHLAQAQAALPYLAEKCLVVCDDTWYNPHWGHYTGKCGAVVPFLLNNGFTVLETEAHPVYGTILGRGIK